MFFDFVISVTLKVCHFVFVLFLNTTSLVVYIQYRSVDPAGQSKLYTNTYNLFPACYNFQISGFKNFMLWCGLVLENI